MSVAVRLLSDDSARITDPMLRRAFELAAQGVGATSPNPMVGCVIAQDDDIVGEGFHAQAGGPHAEAAALAQAGPRAAGATAYVTLEPCNHFGRTPPCSEALISRGIAGVVIGMADPDPVAVGGAARMREAGLEVEFEADPTPYESLNEEWLHHLRHGRPFVRVKVALSLDGRPSCAEETRCRLTGDGGSRITMRLRERADAVLVGASTARIDDPSLTVRAPDGTPAPRQPLRVVLSHTSHPSAISMLHDDLGPSLALHAPDGLQAAVQLLAEDHSVRSLLVEAGPRLLSALWAADLIDELVLVHAGGMIGPQGPAGFLGGGECTAADGLDGTPGPDGAPAPANRGRSCALDGRMRAVEAGVEGDDAVTVWRRREHGS